MFREGTHKWWLLKYLNEHGSITRRDASHRLGISELANRIAEMEKSGIKIDHESDSYTSNYTGKTKYFTRYRLVDEGDK